MGRLDNELTMEIKRRTEMNKSTQIVSYQISIVSTNSACSFFDYLSCINYLTIYFPTILLSDLSLLVVRRSAYRFEQGFS